MTSITAPLPQRAAGSNARSDASFLGRNWAWLVLRGALALIAACAIFAGVVLISLGLRPRRIAHPVTDGTRGVTDLSDQEIRV